MIRHANAHWNGSGKDGNGTLTTQSTTLQDTQYSFKSRFEEGTGTNPEELIAAAHSGCFSMKLSFSIGAMEFTPETIHTTAKVHFVDGAIPKIELICEAKVPGMSNEKFQEAAKDAKENCPISKLFNAEITLIATLLS